MAGRQTTISFQDSLLMSKNRPVSLIPPFCKLDLQKSTDFCHFQGIKPPWYVRIRVTTNDRSRAQKTGNSIWRPSSLVNESCSETMECFCKGYIWCTKVRAGQKNYSAIGANFNRRPVLEATANVFLHTSILIPTDSVGQLQWLI